MAEIISSSPFQFEAEENHPPDSEESLLTQTKCIQSQIACKNKLTTVSSGNKIRSVINSYETVETGKNLKEESVTAKQESEFVRVFAQLMGEKRWY